MFNHVFINPFFSQVFFENCTLGTALENASREPDTDSSNPTDESGEESDGGGSSSSSYSSLNDFVTDMMNSEIHGDVPGMYSRGMYSRGWGRDGVGRGERR